MLLDIMNLETTESFTEFLLTISGSRHISYRSLIWLQLPMKVLFLGTVFFSALPMGDDANHVIWLSSLAVRHGEKDNHAEKRYEYQRKGIGTAIVKHGLEIAKSLGFTACMTCGNPDVYKRKMGLKNYRELGIKKDDSVEDADECIFAIELVPNGFDGTNRILSFSYYDFFQM